MTAEAAILPGRSLIEIAGEERASFLQGLVTSDVAKLGTGEACFAGLLSPQGKILIDFFVVNAGGAMYLDCPAESAPGLLKRLAMYKLRAKVSLADAMDRWRVAAAWLPWAGDALKAVGAVTYFDPRLPALGFRALVELGKAADLSPDEASYETMRIAAAIPEGGKDYAYGDTFPHDACFDLLRGVSFTKGCYVGQEVVSRMQHRGTARTRVLAVSAGQALPVGGADILAEGFAVGRLGSVDGTNGIALARLDRVGEALASGQQLTASGIPLTLSVPGWADYTLGKGDAAQ